MYNIKYENFEGPLNLLLELFRKKKLDITKLSLAKVADDYLTYIENNRKVSLSNLSDFLLTASQLILIKSKALLPLFEFTEEEEEEIEDLQIRLIEYRKFKDASEKLKNLFASPEKSFSRETGNILPERFVKPNISKEQLAIIFNEIQVQLPKEEALGEELMLEVISLEEKVSQIKASLEKRVRMAFIETVKNAQDKIEVIVSFLAMLEMIKQKIVNVRQENLFSEIQISKRIE